MSNPKNKLTMVLGYTGTDFTRNFIIDGIANADLPQIESKMIAVNASLAGGTDGGLKEFFRADDYDASDPQNIVGELRNIKSARLESTTETVIF